MPVFHDTIHNPVYLNLKSNASTLELNSLKSNMLFELFQPIAVNSNVDTYMTIENFKFTNSIYNVNSYNNIFYFGLDPTYSESSVTVTEGNYSISSLISWLNSNVGSNFTFSYDETTLKVTITNTVEFQLFASSNNILQALGFTQNTYYSSGLSLTSTNLINLTGTQMIYVNMPNLSLNSYGIKNGLNHNTVLSVPITAIQGDTQNASSVFRHKINDSTVTYIQIQIVDENDYEIDFNGVDWYLNISFIFSYKKQYVPPFTLLNPPTASTDDSGEEEDGKKK